MLALVFRRVARARYYRSASWGLRSCHACSRCHVQGCSSLIGVLTLKVAGVGSEPCCSRPACSDPVMPLPAQAPPKLPANVHAAAHAAEGSNPAGHSIPAAAAQKPSPTAALRLETRRVHGWADALGRAHVQLELRLANDSGAAVPDVTIACPACEVQTLWNVRERAAGDHRPAQGDAGQAWGVCEHPEAGPPPSVGLQGEPGFSWKQLWRRRPQPGAAGHQAPAASHSQGASGDSSMRAAGLPAWMLEQGGLPCGGELVFGGIFYMDQPSINVAPS